MEKFSVRSSCGLCLTPGDTIHHLDHLVVICHILHIPIVTDEESAYQSLLRYYPQVQPIYILEHQYILNYLADHYDMLFVSAANYRRDLTPIFDMMFCKSMRFCYCPHGNSDKPMTQFSLQNLSLIYGGQMEERLSKTGIIQQLDGYVRTGNYRFPFYWKYQAFYDAITEKEVFAKFEKKQTTLLYAPTWQDMEHSSSLFDVGSHIIDQLPSHYNLIVKLHPWLQHYQAGYVHLMQERYQNRPNIVILSLFPLVLPLLKRTDIYLGDLSSVGYDFLYFNRPMFFFDPKQRERSRKDATQLYACGTLIPEVAYHNIYRFIEHNLETQDQYKDRREQIYLYTFGRDRDFSEIRKEIINKIYSWGVKR